MIKISPPVQPLQTIPEIAAARLKICQNCPENSQGRCRLGGCCAKPIAEMVWLATRSCPKNLWRSEIKFSD